MSDDYKKRTNSAQLPSPAEVLDILKNESQREALRYDFVEKNTSVFDALRELAVQANVDVKWIETYATLEVTDLFSQINTAHEQLTNYVIDHPEHTALYIKVFEALVIPDDTTPSDALFVFGAATNARIDRAIELYTQGIAPKILISGKSPHYVEGQVSEAQRMATYAVEQGIPPSQLLLEEESITLPDNVKRSIDLLESLDWKPASLTIISTNFVLTRAYMEWYKFCPWDITIHAVSAHPQSKKFTAQHWTEDPKTIALVLNEYIKLIVESKIDLMHLEGEVV